MRNLRFLLMVVSAMVFTMGSLHPSYAMSFGKHNNAGGAAAQNITHGNAGNGNGKENGNGNGSYGASLDAQAYAVPVPEPGTVVLLASGLFSLGLWRWKKNSSAA
jgi:hypothetical protein